MFRFKPITSFLAIAVCLSSSTAYAQHFGKKGGVGDVTTTYNNGEPVGGTYSINGTTGKGTFTTVDTIGPNTWTQPQSTIITNTPTTDGAAHTVQNSAKTASGIYAPISPNGWHYWDSTRSVIDMEPGASVINANAYGAYTYNNIAQGSAGATNNVVGFFVNSVNAKDNAATWGINTSCDDNSVNGLATLTGRKCIGYEADFTANGASTFQGISLIMQGPGTPASANAFSVSTSGGNAKWTYGFSTGDGAAQYAASIGAVSSTGANIGSQSVTFNYFNSSGSEHANFLQSINGAFNFTGNEFNDGLYLQSGTGNVNIGVTGSSTNANINLYAAGTGQIIPHADITGNVNVTAKSLNTTQPNTWSQAQTFNPDGLDLTPLSAFASRGVTIAGSNNSHGAPLVAYYVNNGASNTNSLNAAGNLWGDLPAGATGNQVFGGYSLATIEATTGAAIGHEITVRNNTGISPDANLAPNLAIGTTTVAPIGENLTCGGNADCSIGLNVTAEGGSSKYFLTGMYVGHYRNYGLFIDANANATGIVSKVGGTGLALHMQNVGTYSPSYTMMDMQDVNANTRYALKQDGSILTKGLISNGLSVPTISTCSGAGTGSSCVVATGGNDAIGTITITGGTSATAAGGTVSVSFSTPMNAPHSASCILQPAMNWSPNSYLAVSAQNLNGFSFTYLNGGGTGIALTNGTTYSVNYQCNGY